MSKQIMGMITILIPVYNYDLTPLVNCLHQVIEDSNIYDEIIIGADGCDTSCIKTFRALAKLPKVKLFISKPNIGRAAIRNRLTDEAKGSHVLFIDADALIEGSASFYLNKWVEDINIAPVICGGTAYRDLPPDDPDKHKLSYRSRICY